MDLQALVCMSNLHEPHKNKNHFLINGEIRPTGVKSAHCKLRPTTVIHSELRLV